MQIGWPKTGWNLPKQRNFWPVVQPMSEPCEFEFVAQIGNHTSKSEASIQSETALNAGETENSLTDRLEAEKICETFGYKNKFQTKTSVSRR